MNDDRPYTCWLCELPILEKERYRRLKTEVDGFRLEMPGHIQCIKFMQDVLPDAMPAHMDEEKFKARLTENMKETTADEFLRKWPGMERQIKKGGTPPATDNTEPTAAE